MFNDNSTRPHEPADPAGRREDDGIFYREDRSAIFIDGANLYGAARALGFEIDYKKLLKWGASKGRLVRAFYYTALIEDQEYSPIRPLVDWLDYNGYTMVTKPTKEFTDAMGRRKIKGNMDIELAIDVLEMAEHAVGAERFQRGVRAYLAAHARGTVDLAEPFLDQLVEGRQTPPPLRLVDHVVVDQDERMEQLERKRGA